jgi:diguanylate cyclase (GGDEF)-like protein
MWPINKIESFLGRQAKSYETYGIVVIDIDYLTRFCLRFDTHEINSIMDEIHKYFRDKMPEGSEIWRSDGDEFLICCPRFDNCELDQFYSTVRRDFRRQRFAKHSKKEFSNVAMTFSAGIASYPTDGSDLYEVIRKATVALFLAKAFRRNRVCVAPNAEISGKNNVLFNENLKIEIILGHYGEIGYAEEVIESKKARLWEPQAIDVDAEGNLYIADQNNNAILKYDGSKVVRIAGDGFFGYSGDGGEAVRAKLNGPFWVSIWQPNYLLIADAENNCIRICNLKTNIIQTLVGNGEPGYHDSTVLDGNVRLNIPAGMVVDSNNKILYIVDYGNNAIRRVMLEQPPC